MKLEFPNPDDYIGLIVRKTGKEKVLGNVKERVFLILAIQPSPDPLYNRVVLYNYKAGRIVVGDTSYLKDSFKIIKRAFHLDELLK